MRALVQEKLGNPLARLGDSDCPYRVRADWPPPPLGRGEVRIKVAASALNFADSLVAKGTYQEKPPLPTIPGSECSGTVIEIGADVRTLKVGDKVTALASSGGFAEEVCVAEGLAVALSPDLSDRRLIEAAGLPVAYGTAWLALHERGRVQPGETLVVLGAAGGVGLACVQLGILAGARVVAVCRGAVKADLLRKIGAHAVVDSAEVAAANPKGGQGPGTFRGALKAAAPGGIDLIFDPVGGAQQTDALRLARPECRLLVIGFAAGLPQVPLNVALVKNLSVLGVYWGAYQRFKKKVFRESLAEPARLFARGDLDVNISHVYGLEQVDEAMAVMLNRKVVGKLVLVPRGISTSTALL